MSEQLKFIVSELNKSPFDKNYNLISFDGLSGELLLQNLSDVLAEVDSKNRLDIREEEPAATALRILGMLRVLKYKPPDEISQGFRQGLVDGNKQVFRLPKTITTYYENQAQFATIPHSKNFGSPVTILKIFQVIYPVLEWLLSRIPELKTRAYLAKYLVKVEVGPEVIADPDVSDLYEQYEGLINQFKDAHKELQAVKNSG